MAQLCMYVEIGILNRVGTYSLRKNAIIVTDGMMEDDDDDGQPSGFLSPRRIEAIHIAFNKVFENARREGIIRDLSTYPSLDDIYEMVMRGEPWPSDNNKKEDEGDEEQDDTGRTTDKDQDEEISSQQQTLERGEIGRRPERSVQVVVNSQESVDNDIMFSDDEDEYPVRPQKYTPSRKSSHSKRVIDYVDDQQEYSNTKKKQRSIHSDPPSIPSNHHQRTVSVPRRILSDPESAPQIKPRRGKGRPKRQSVQQGNEEIDRDIKSNIFIYQRHCPPKPRGLHIPFWGRRRGRSRKISLDRLWEVHYRLERLRKAGLPLATIKSPARSIQSGRHNGHLVERISSLGRGSGGRSRTRGSRGRGRGGRGRGRSDDHSGGRNFSHGGVPREIPSLDYTTAASTDVNMDEHRPIGNVNLKPRGKPRMRGRGKRVFVSGFMGQERSPEL